MDGECYAGQAITITRLRLRYAAAHEHENYILTL